MKEVNRHILQNAIKKLPLFKLVKELWPSILIRVNEANDKTESSYNLPEYKAPCHVWNKIENDLDIEPLLRARLELPEFSAPDRVWNKIDSQLKAPVRLNLKIVFRYAAAIVLLAGTMVGVLQIKSNSDITYSTEIVPVEHVVIPDNLQTDVTQKLCLHNPVACTKPEYIELERQLKDVSKELDKLYHIKAKSNNQQPIKYIYMLENKRIEIEKKMVKMVLET